MISTFLNNIEFNIKYKTFYYTTMQKLCGFGVLSRPKNQCKCHKDIP